MLISGSHADLKKTDKGLSATHFIKRRQSCMVNENVLRRAAREDERVKVYIERNQPESNFSKKAIYVILECSECFFFVTFK